jgi:peptidylprolyl isomerase domain and WD repeat-containing protein 1
MDEQNLMALYFSFIAVLKHEHLYLENLPTCDTYEKSYMHRDVITHILITK